MEASHRSTNERAAGRRPTRSRRSAGRSRAPIRPYRLILSDFGPGSPTLRNFAERPDSHGGEALLPHGTAPQKDAAPQGRSADAVLVARGQPKRTGRVPSRRHNNRDDELEAGKGERECTRVPTVAFTDRVVMHSIRQTSLQLDNALAKGPDEYRAFYSAICYMLPVLARPVSELVIVNLSEVHRHMFHENGSRRLIVVYGTVI
jgi:hypothetical protein